MSYCRWLEGDLHAYSAQDSFHVHVSCWAATRHGLKEVYDEPSAQALMARMLWLGAKGCAYPWDALRHIKEDVIAEVEQSERLADGRLVGS
ncbi:hypothetical protein [Sphingomonas sp. 37zxx]|uniref:hypothetical protein n=1 Tax=Sphingomonas sp. 37zxx TaxID=1550073 RepID=UPI00053BFF1F|nr:hypothetical protein [Sphingomonas sp. 37zxx]